jgi:bifunctional non-homologous end joining protein LigD
MPSGTILSAQKPSPWSDNFRTSPYVVQKHAARQLHYDFRLELDGVLKSWAVTRGPSLVPADKRLAVEVEDHPIEYGSFEGTIPKGQYGGGSVIVWDRGTWAPEGDARKGLAKGHLDFRLDGEKLRGRWHLVRMARQRGKKRTNWLLIKAKDEDARTQGEPDILVEEPQSVASGREVEQIGEADDVWDSSEGRMAHGGAKRAASNKAKSKRASKSESAPRSATPVKARGRSVAVTLTHPDRIYWPDAGLTKQGLADYYADVWKWMAPHVIARPLALLRCPDGIAKQCFFQKQPWKGLHQSIAVLSNPGAGGDKFLAVENLDGVVALVQAGVLEIHPWGSTVGDLGHPDRLIFDLDPGPHVGWAALVDAAVEVRERLGRDGLASFVKTSGGKGLHVVAPLRPEADWTPRSPTPGASPKRWPRTIRSAIRPWSPKPPARGKSSSTISAMPAALRRQCPTAPAPAPAHRCRHRSPGKSLARSCVAIVSTSATSGDGFPGCVRIPGRRSSKSRSPCPPASPSERRSAKRSNCSHAGLLTTTVSAMPIRCDVRCP